MYSLAMRLAANGTETLVAADKPYTTESLFAFKSFNVPRVVRPYFKRLALGRLPKIPEIVICDSWKSVNSVPKWDVKLVVLAHGQEYLEPSENRIKRIQKALSRASLVVASSQLTAELVRRVTQQPHVEVIYPTYMLSSPTVLDEKVESLPQILSLCRIERRKGLFQSAHALASLKKQGIDFRWTIAGNGPNIDELKEEISNLGLAHQTVFAGRVDDETKTALLNQADLFLMPSYQAGRSLEGFGISYIEAASFGIPSIAGIAGGAPEAVLDGITGWCVDGSDTRAIEAALNVALTDTELRRAYGKAAASRFSEELLGDRVFDRFLKLAQG